MDSIRQIVRYEIWEEQHPYPSLPWGRDRLWISRNGSMTAVQDLDDGHLLNIERMLRGHGLTKVDPNAPAAVAWRPIIYEEMVRRNLVPFERYTGAFGERGYGV